MTTTQTPSRLNRFAWLVVWYVGAVILLGTVVRVTGSGAGCGKHWPTCQGDLFLLPRSVETLIEWSHRLTSGLSLVAVLVLAWWSRKHLPRGHAARTAAYYAVLFVLVESLIGAVLVVFGLVVGDRSLARAVMVPVHLVNASLLMASLVLAAHHAQNPSLGARLPSLRKNPQVAYVLLALLVTSMLGAVTALGDTLFPPNLQLSLAQRLQFDQSAQAHFLEKLRIIHPVVAVCAAIFAARTALVTWAEETYPSHVRRLSLACLAGLVAQILAGVLNVWLGAPATVQVVHLGLALLLFGLFVLQWAYLEALTPHPRPSMSPITAP